MFLKLVMNEKTSVTLHGPCGYFVRTSKRLKFHCYETIINQTINIAEYARRTIILILLKFDLKKKEYLTACYNSFNEIHKQNGLFTHNTIPCK